MGCLVQPAARWAAGLLMVLCVALPGAAVAGGQTSVRAFAAQSFGVDPAALDLVEVKGPPPVTEVYRNQRLLGYVASTWDVAGSAGYSGKPIDILLAVDLNGRIAGVHLLEQSEPILTIGIEEEDIEAFVQAFQGLDYLARSGAQGGPEAIAGATVSSGVIRDGIIRTLRTVAYRHGMPGGAHGRRLDLSAFVPKNWSELVAEGALVSRRITLGEARDALGADLYKAADLPDETLYAELTTAILSPPLVGQNLLGRQEYSALLSAAPADAAIVFVAGRGLYSFKGTRWRQSGVFDRLELRQQDLTIPLMREGYRNIEALEIEGAPQFREVAAFEIPAATGFDPARPWKLSLLAEREGEGTANRVAAFELSYSVPESLLAEPPAGEAAAQAGAFSEGQLWLENWNARRYEIVLLSIVLLVLLSILFLQNMLASRRKLYRIVRVGFLLTTFIVLGLMLGAQLSVVHVLTFAQAVRTEFRWETFLLDPLVFILWGFVAAALLFWGRGVFCGWLCPFGALQELLNEAARKLGIRQLELPFGLHERLWPIKYIIFLALFAISLGSMTYAFTAAEVEPFKTAITMKWARPWPFVAFAAVLLLVGLFIERFYCRYLCPLGAALAIPARLRMFEWLKRRYQCGRECRICAVHCTVQAIHPDGKINPNECIYCLNCQANYFDPNTCPPLKARVERRAARASVRAGGQRTSA